MRIDDNIKKCVGFVGYKVEEKFVLAGTLFFVHHKSFKTMGYAVTAKHVIKAISSKSSEVCMRLNLIVGIYEKSSKITDWIEHEDFDVDIAIMPLGPYVHEGSDQMFITESMFVNQKYIDANGVGPGDDVFIVGLFRQHHGKSKNLPIVRIGNIAAMPEEKIQTTYHSMDGYLIEARSIGGLSGSPVFISLPVTRIGVWDGQEIIGLLGLIYGHFDLPRGYLDDVIEDVSGGVNVNVGIAIVTPITKIAEMFEYPTVKEVEMKWAYAH